MEGFGYDVDGGLSGFIAAADILPDTLLAYPRLTRQFRLFQAPHTHSQIQALGERLDSALEIVQF